MTQYKDFCLNRVYWKYSNGSYMRPEGEFSVRATPPKYKTHSDSLLLDYKTLVSSFARRYKNYSFVISLSGGIDSEICADTFYQLNIPFRAVSLNLFDGANLDDIAYAYEYCRARGIDHTTIHISHRELIYQCKKAVKLGQFTHSISQIALTKLLDEQKEGEILINSGHNPDFNLIRGIGWYEDSPNYVKYAINTNKKFFTFTSLEEIFCHYAKNIDTSELGYKNNAFIYREYPHLKKRIKATGWENLLQCVHLYYELIRKLSKQAPETFITWKDITDNAEHNIKKINLF